MNRDSVLQTIYAAIEEVNEQLDLKQQLAKTPETVLIGTGGKLDSLGMVNFIVALEQRVHDDLNLEISLADHLMNPGMDNPLSSVNTLVDYITSLL